MHIHQLSVAACKVSKFIYSNKYSAVIVSGGSNQLSRALLTYGWRSRYGNTPLPRIFIFPRKVNHLMYKSVNGLEEYRDWVRAWISANMAELNKYQNLPLCLVDDYAMSGVKCTELSTMFKALGFERVDFALFASSRRAELPVNVFVACTSNELTRELCELSLLIQGEPCITDLQQQILNNPEQRRERALTVLREVNHAQSSA